jgi:glycosyltransferase involved in cell wall biosynthesis
MVHEASRTGAPILAWNIAHALRDTHDVIVFLKQGGPLREHFAAVCTSIVEMPDEEGLHVIDRDAVMVRLAREIRPAFAIANSAETREFVRALAGAGVGVVHLIHEFSASVRPYGSVYDFLPWAHRLVFPAQLVADSFQDEHPYLSRRRFDILPQGAGILPSLGGKPFGSAGQADLVRKRLRPPSHEKDFLVIGLGSVIPRKGVDLFVALAARAGAASPSGRGLRFVWIGKGFEPRTGSEFASQLGDQIARSGVSAHCEILDELDDLDAVFAEANLFVLPSRLDPMPNTMIDAMSAGVPLLCFDQASGIAEVLGADPATAHLVVPYLDVSAMSTMVHRFADDESALADASDAVESLARRSFAMKRYCADLLRLGAEAAGEAEAIARDYDAIAAAPSAFCPTVFNGTWPTDDRPQDLLHTYLLRGRVAGSDLSAMPIGLRRPLPGFNPSIYAEDCLGPDRTRDPLAHWLEAGRPGGRWTHRLIALEDARPAAVALKVLLHGHFFYVDLIEDFLQRVGANASVIDVILTVPGDEQAAIAGQAVARAPIRGEVEIRVVGNRGRDIGPFLTGLKREVFSGYDLVGHIHGKRSPHVAAVSGERWRTFLWEHLLGSRVAAADACLKAFAEDPSLGLVFPEDPNLHGWDANHDIAARLAQRMGCRAPLPAAFEWPIGTMFWARPAALKPLFDLDLDWSDYPQEPLPGDGTLLHALERLIPFAVEHAQFGYAASHLLEMQR